MYCYSVFGGCLETDIEFPELRRIEPREPRWLVVRSGRLPERAHLRLIGDQHIYADVHARLFRHEDGFRIVVDDTGSFDIDPSGSRIFCEEKPDAWPDFLRAHVLGRVLATALYSRGWMPLHGSAVQCEAGIVGFLAPKGFGKSTIALALAKRGARLVTDDTLPVELTSPPRAWPGVHSVRIKNDSMAALGISEADFATREGKGIVTSLAENQLAVSADRIAALYLLQPLMTGATNGHGAPGVVQRERLTPPVAAVSLVANFKLARMMGPTEAAEVLRRSAAIAGGTPVFRLGVPRDLAQLQSVADELLALHARRATPARAVFI